MVVMSKVKAGVGGRGGVDMAAPHPPAPWLHPGLYHLMLFLLLLKVSVWSSRRARIMVIRERQMTLGV